MLKRFKEVLNMARRRRWTHTEKKKLAENYETSTIKELLDLLPGRNADMINAQIKRLKAAKKIEGGKTEEAIQRAYNQREM
jgi:hypothetical protein